MTIEEIHESMEEKSNVNDKDTESQESGTVEANFTENEVDMVMSLSEEAYNEFPEGLEAATTNNNATVSNERMPSSQGSTSAGASTTPMATHHVLPHRSQDQPSPQSTKTLQLMQDYMVRKGLISNDMTEEQIQEYLAKEVNKDQVEQINQKRREVVSGPRVIEKVDRRSQGNQPVDINSNISEVTIYRRAVKQLDPNLEDKITELLKKTRVDVENKEKRKVSYSSDENYMDSSDDSVETLNLAQIDKISELPFTGSKEDEQQPVAGPSKEKNPEQEAEEFVHENEKSKERMYELPGPGIELLNQSKISVASMDQDYQMIDAHVDESFKKKVINFEYIDFAKLIAKSKTIKDEERQRLEIISKNGMSFLSPAVDREEVQVNNYLKWEQAFRIYSNIITGKYPHKATELLQYNHTIYTASMSYVWDNVYAYDKEFRYHISRHPHRPWNIILQQAWTMILKDRIKNDNAIFQRGQGHGQGHQGKNKRNREACKRFNKGKCNFGLSCQYDHRCTVPECGKFGHGAHICRLRNGSNSSRDSQDISNHSNHKAK